MEKKTAKMKRTVFKITLFVLLLALLVPAFAGCARESDEAMLAIAEEQLAVTAKVNEICFGAGLAAMEKDGYPMSGYLETTEESRAKYGVSSVEDIKKMIASAYTVAASDSIDQVIFRPVQVDGSYASYRRYVDAVDDDVTHLMVKKDYLPLTEGEVSYSNLRLASHGRSRAEVLVDVTVTDGTQTRTDKDVLLRLRFEEGTWKYDTLTYASIR